jgi:hypothetical protein
MLSGGMRTVSLINVAPRVRVQVRRAPAASISNAQAANRYHPSRAAAEHLRAWGDLA